MGDNVGATERQNEREIEMTKNRFQITIDSTKASEIKALKRIAEKTGPYSYIGTLLTPEFLEWAEDRINSDFTLDIFYNGKTAERNYRKASEEIRELTAKVQRRDDEIEALKIARDIARHEAEESEGRYQDRIVERNREISELKAALNGKTEKISDLVHKSVQKDNEISELKQQVTEIKAKLYDLTQS
jgi:hypothetical protein